MNTSYLVVLLLLIAAASAAVYRKKLTPAAGFTAVLVGLAVYAGGGYPGLLLLALFFLLGTAATSWQKEKKLTIQNNAAHQSTRTPGQVIANGGVAAIAGMLAILFPSHQPLFRLALAASLSSATADTLASELGMVYGRRFFNILTWKTDQRGQDGVISIEGTFAGMIGSAIIGALFVLASQSTAKAFLIIFLAGTFGNLIDSVLGALFERKGLLTNDTVNFCNTLAAALLGILLY
jgi:uncharacterized protein (TIGR00297 family)